MKYCVLLCLFNRLMIFFLNTMFTHITKASHLLAACMLNIYLIISLIPGWPLISSVTIHSVPNLFLCHEVTVHIYSESSLKSVKLEYRSEYSQYWKGVILTPEQSWVVVHRLCNLTYSTPYWVRVAGSNSYGFSPLGIIYNFTTDSMPRVKLAMEAASSSSLASVSVAIVCFLVTLSRIFV